MMYMVFTALTLILTVLYTSLILLYRKGWGMQPDFAPPAGFVPQTSITVVIPARNEAANIGNCIRSILQQNYPKHLLEIVVVDDHSTDGTAAIVESFTGNITCIRLVDHINDANIVAYKKKALATAISMSAGKLIVTTDADCTAGPDWLRHIAALYERDKPVMIVAPVDFAVDGSVVSVFQSLDFMSMQGITGAAHRLKMGNMCNGANLAFSRKAYISVNGYEGIDHLASGDDYLLMMKLQHVYKGRIAYLKSAAAIVRTLPQPDWGGFLQQRIRWASKSGKYDDKKLTAVLLLVYLYNVALLSVFIVAVFIPSLLPFAAFSLLLKIVVELYYLHCVAHFFGKRSQLVYFPFLQPLHIIYIVVAGFLGFAGVYRWKGRVVR